MTQDQTTEQFVTRIFNVVTNDGDLYRNVISPGIYDIRAYGGRTPLCEYAIPDTCPLENVPCPTTKISP